MDFKLGGLKESTIMNQNPILSAFIVVVFSIVCVTNSYGQTSGTVHYKNGKKTSVKIQSMNANQIVASISGKKTTIPRWQFQSIAFTGQPNSLSRMQRLIGQKQYEEAFQVLKQNRFGKPKEEIRQEIRYTVAKVHTELVLSGNSLSNPTVAAKSIESFLEKAQNKNYRCSDTIFLKSQLLVSQGNSDQAIKALNDFADQAKGELIFDCKLRLGILLISEEKFSEAKTAFQQALKSTNRTGSDLAIAKLGIAAADSSESGIAAAEDAIRKILENTDPEDAKVCGYAYNFLGNAFLKAENSKAAEVAFLHTDLLFSQNSQAHSEALYRLARIWRNNGKTTRYTEAINKLKKKYGGSSWTKKLGG